MDKYQIAENIKMIRLLKKLTQEYVADQLGMSQANYSRIENGQIEFTITNLNNIAKALSVDVNVLIDLNNAGLLNGQQH